MIKYSIETRRVGKRDIKCLFYVWFIAFDFRQAIGLQISGYVVKFTREGFAGWALLKLIEKHSDPSICKYWYSKHLCIGRMNG